MNQITRMVALVLVIIFACTAGLTACAPATEAVISGTSEQSSTATTSAAPSSAPAPTPSPVPPESLTEKQIREIVWNGTDNLFGQLPEKIYVFYIKLDGAGKLIWAEKESNPGGGGFDLFDVFNGEFLFHVSIPIEEEAKVTPADFSKYIDEVNEMLQNYNVVAAAKLFEISDLYLKNNIESAKTEGLYEALTSHFYEAFSSFHVSSKEALLDAFIDVTPPQYILPIWEYVPSAVTPDSNFNPPSPTVIPAPELTLEQKELLLGINDKFQNYDVGNVITFIVKFLNRDYRFWTVYSFNEDKTNNETDCYVYDFYNIFNMEYLFSVSVPQKDKSGQPVSLAMYKKFLSETAPSLKGMSLYLSFTLSSVAAYYEDWEIEYNNNPTLKEWADMQLYGTEADYDKVKDTPLSKEKSLELFLDSTPQEEILPFWVFTPGGQIPEELKEIYSEANYPPAPAE